MQHDKTTIHDVLRTKQGKKVVEYIRRIRNSMEEDIDNTSKEPWMSLIDLANAAMAMAYECNVKQLPHRITPLQRAKLASYLIREEMNKDFDLWTTDDPDRTINHNRGPMIVYGSRMTLMGELLKPVFYSKLSMDNFFLNRPRVWQSKTSPHIQYDARQRLRLPVDGEIKYATDLGYFGKHKSEVQARRELARQRGQEKRENTPFSI